MAAPGLPLGLTLSLNCQRTDCPETAAVDVTDPSYLTAPITEVLWEAVRGDELESGWVLEVGGTDYVLHCPAHATGGQPVNV